MLLISGKLVAQDSLSFSKAELHSTIEVFKKAEKKTDELNAKLLRHSEKYIKKLQKEEQKLNALINRLDSNAAKTLFNESLKDYKLLNERLHDKIIAKTSFVSRYIPHLDTLQTLSKFMVASNSYLDKQNLNTKALQDAVQKFEGLQASFDKAKYISEFTMRRKAIVEAQLRKLGLSNKINRLSRDFYYYRQRTDEYKEAFDNPSLIEGKAISLLNRNKKFKEYFAKNSQLSALFQLQSSSATGNNQPLPGLQTKESIEQDLTKKFGSKSTVNGLLQQEVHHAKLNLAQLKQELTKHLGTTENIAMPDFKPNSQRTKSFFKRLELGSNMQTIRGSRYLPATTDIGLSVGYKINDKSIVGFGGSYKLGWVQSFTRFKSSHEGAGIRTFLDYRIKGGFWLTGGGEMNYKAAFDRMSELKEYSAWTKSALIGLTKKYNISKITKGNIQILYDVLWRTQTPASQPLILRLGYKIK